MTNKNNIDSFEVALGKFKIKAQGENVPQLIHDIFSKNIGVWALGAGAITVAIGIAKLIIKDIDKGTKWLFDPIIEKPTPAPIQPSTADTSASIQDVAAEESIPMPTTESMADLIRKDVEMPERLIGDLLCSEDICILLGGTGQMKSILAMQMAIEISCGFESPLVPEDEEIKPQKVIYFDGELKDSDIKERYGKTDSAFLNNIDRITDCWEFSPDQLLNVVETYVLKVSGDCTVIFDNYYSLFKNATEKQVVNIREKLKSIQKKALGRVTFIIVVHTTKNGDKKSLDVNDIYGSSYFRNLASIIIGINQTDCNKNHKSLTILKTTGNRSLHEGQVLHERLVDNVYLHFKLDSINGEPTSNSLSEDGDDHDEQTDSNSVPNPTGFSHEMKVHIWTLNKKHSMSYDKIVEAYMKKGVKISRSSVGNYVNEIEAEMNSQQPSDI